LSIAEFFQGVPGVGINRCGEGCQWDVVARAAAYLVDAPAQVLDGRRVGDPAGLVPDRAFDGGIGVTANQDGRVGFWTGLGRRYDESKST
jgi:hypothetical protein